jgi:hypothetical protein
MQLTFVVVIVSQQGAQSTTTTTPTTPASPSSHPPPPSPSSPDSSPASGPTSSSGDKHDKNIAMLRIVRKAVASIDEGAADTVGVCSNNSAIITAECCKMQVLSVVDRVGLLTNCVFIDRSDKRKRSRVFKCRLYDNPGRKHRKNGSAGGSAEESADGEVDTGADGVACGCADGSEHGSGSGSAPSREFGKAAPRKAPRDTSSGMCQCKAKITFTIKGDVAHLRMNLQHTGHIPNTPDDLLRLPLRQEVRGELAKLTKITRSYRAIRRALKTWVEKELKGELGLQRGFILKYVDRRFNPTSEDIHNALQHRAREFRLSEIDQEDTLKQLCTEKDLAWSFRPHAGGHASVMHLPKQGLYIVGTRSNLKMDIRLLTTVWEEEVFQDGLTKFLQSTVARTTSSETAASKQAEPSPAHEVCMLRLVD